MKNFLDTRKGSPAGAYAFGWSYWQRRSPEAVQAARRGAVLEAVCTVSSGVALAAICYLWAVALFSL